MNNQQLIAYPQGTTEPLSYPTGEVVLDLFKDEPIPLTLNVDDFTNVAEAEASYSLPMELPGTKNNNLFFNHIYDITSDSNFNPHKKTKIIVKEGTINTFEGYMQLNEIVIKEGAITYEVILFSEGVNLKDLLSERVFRDIDLYELSHNYTKTNIINSWTGTTSYAASGTSGFRTGASVKYPLVRWNNESWYVGNELNANDSADLFKPFVNAKYLFDRIITDAGYNYTSTFLNSTDFTKLYVDFNNVADINSFSDGFSVRDVDTTDVYSNPGSKIDFTATSTTPSQTIVPADYFDLATDVFTAPSDQLKVNVSGTLWFDNPSGSTSYATLLLVKTIAPGNPGFNQNYTLFSNESIADNGSSYAPTSKSFNTAAWNIKLNTGDTLHLTLKVTGGDCSLMDATALGTSLGSRAYFHLESDLINFNSITANYKGDVNQWDFVKGFIDMFKLVMIADYDNPNNINIEPYKDWVDTGNLIDLTNKVDVDEFKYKPIEGLAKQINFKLTEDDADWITTAHNKPNDWKYSHKEVNDIDIYDEDVEDIEVKEYAATYVKNLFNGCEIYAPQIIDIDFNTHWENKLRLLYDNGVQTLLTDTFDVGDFNSHTDYLLFSMVDSYPINANTSNSYNFGVVNYAGAGGAVLNSLYNVYWLKYIDELYHKDTRIVSLEAYLNADDISKIKFNDIILIKNKKYRLHKIEYRAGAMSKLELITIKDL